MPSQTVTAALDSDTLTLPRTTRSGAKVRARAPLRLGLAGGGTDVSPYCDRFGGVVLNASIDRYCHATIEERTDGQVIFVAPDCDMVAELTEDGSHLPLHAAVYRRLNRDFSLGRPGLTVTTVIDAPPGSGLGSSSALVVALIEAFREYFSLPLGEYEIAGLAVDIERVDCSLDGGRQDQYSATFGGFNMMEFGGGGHVVINPLRLKPAIVRELEASLVLFHTGLSRASAHIIEEQSDHVRRGSQVQIDATHVLRREALAMKDALVVGDLGKLAGVLESGWMAKKQLATGISTPAIEEAFFAAIRAGALAGKVSGAGGGGYIIFLVEPTVRPRVANALASQLGGTVEPVHFVEEGAVAWTLR